MNLEFDMKIKMGTFKQKASPWLSYFVIVCCIIITSLLFIMQKSEVAAEAISSKSDYSSYLNYYGD